MDTTSAKKRFVSGGHNWRPDGLHPPYASRAPRLSAGLFFSSHAPNKDPHTLVAPRGLRRNATEMGYTGYTQRIRSASDPLEET